MVPQVHTSQLPNDILIGSAVSVGHIHVINRQRDHAPCYICSNSTHLMHCMRAMRPNNYSNIVNTPPPLRLIVTGQSHMLATRIDGDHDVL